MRGVDRLEEAIRRVRDRTSLYWAFHDPAEAGAAAQDVEVRLDLPLDGARRFEAPPGWRVREIKWGRAVFMRRRQRVSEAEVEEMLVEMLRLAHAQSGQLHSWTCGLRD
ncbi:MAG: hypothetical protein ACXW27_07480 [Allosphingosinicella sp.]